MVAGVFLGVRREGAAPTGLTPLSWLSVLLQYQVVTQNELAEVVAKAGDDAICVADLDGMAATEWQDQRPAKFYIALFVPERIAVYRLASSPVIGDIQ